MRGKIIALPIGYVLRLYRSNFNVADFITVSKQANTADRKCGANLKMKSANNLTCKLLAHHSVSSQGLEPWILAL